MKANNSLDSQRVYSMGPPPSSVLSDRELLKEHFYLEKFLKLLETCTNMPTLPDSSLLAAIKKENQTLEQVVEARREDRYEQYLEAQLQALEQEAKNIK